MKNFIFFAIVLASFQIFAADADADFNVDTCLENADSNMAMKDCVFQEWEIQDKKLNSVYKELMAAIKSDKSEEGKEIVKRVVTAQKSWIQFRDATCAVEGIDMLNGSGEGLIVGGCNGRLTRERVDYLVELKNELTGEK